MDGYWGNPDATAQAFADDPDGRGRWLRTGDAGRLDADGFLLVTDRIKDIIVTSGGKNIAPQPIESMLLADPLFEQAVLLGDNRPFLTLLVKPSLPQLGALAERMQEPYEQLADLLTNPRIVAEIIRRARGLTQKLPSHEQFKDLRVLLEEFTPDNGLLTPTLKVKRREVERRFAQLVDEMYARVEQMRSGLRADEVPA
jgi:long-chain acyl-CoA synthetase